MFGVDSTITSILGRFLVMLMRHIRICVLFGLFPQSPRALCVCAKLLQSYLTLCNPMDCSPVLAPLSMGFPRQEYWSGLSFPSLELLAARMPLEERSYRMKGALP